MAVGSVDVTYRGIFQKSLAGVITKELVKAARREGKIGGTVQRYSDSPERNGIPAKQFAVIADDEAALRVEMAKYEPDTVVAICVLDDTLLKGIESWAWYGVRPVTAGLSPGGTLLVVSERPMDELVRWVPKAGFDWTLALLARRRSFGGLWVYNDDGTDMAVLGALSRATGGLVALESLVAGGEGSKREELLLEGQRSLQLRPIAAGEGAEGPYKTPSLPAWDEMSEGLAIPAVGLGLRNMLFEKFTTRTARPVVDFDRCVRCQICYTACPDECFDPTPGGHYAVDYGHCCGCGICAQACPVSGCIEMVDELAFEGNEDLHRIYAEDPPAYRSLRESALERSGGPIAHYGVF